MLYVVNNTPRVNNGSVSVIDTASGDSVATIPVGDRPQGIGLSPDGTRAYVTNFGYQGSPDDQTVSVIDTATNQVVGNPIPVGANPARVAVSPDGHTVYVTNRVSGTVSVIDTASGNVTAIDLGANSDPWGIVLNGDGTTAYVAESGAGVVAVIDTGTGSVQTIPSALALTFGGCASYGIA